MTFVFCWKKCLVFVGGLTFKNRGHTGCRQAFRHQTCGHFVVLPNHFPQQKQNSGLASSELGRLERSMVEMEMEPPRPMNGTERASLAWGRGEGVNDVRFSKQGE